MVSEDKGVIVVVKIVVCWSLSRTMEFEVWGAELRRSHPIVWMSRSKNETMTPAIGRRPQATLKSTKGGDSAIAEKLTVKENQCAERWAS